MLRTDGQWANLKQTTWLRVAYNVSECLPEKPLKYLNFALKPQTPHPTPSTNPPQTLQLLQESIFVYMFIIVAQRF